MSYFDDWVLDDIIEMRRDINGKFNPYHKKEKEKFSKKSKIEQIPISNWEEE